MIALAARENAVAILLATFDVKLAREFDGGFGSFRAAGSEINAAAGPEIRRSHRQQPLGKFFRWSGVKLQSVRESNLRRLLRHGAPDFGDTVANADNRCLSGSVEKSPAVLSDDPATFPARDNRERLFEMAREKSATRRHEMTGREL